MSTSHPVNRTTEWYDVQVKYGNYDPLPDEVKNEQISRNLQDAVGCVDPLEALTLKDMDRLEDALEEDVLAKYRRARLEEMKAQQKLERFGEMVDVTAAEYIDEVTNASKANDGNQVVVCLLYEDAVPGSRLLQDHLRQIAAKNKHVKFCQGIGHKVIPNFREQAAPTLIIYRGGRCERQVVGTSLFGGPKMTAESVEWILARKFKIIRTDLTENPLGNDDGARGHKGSVLRMRRRESDSEGEEEKEEEEPTAAILHTAANDRGYGDFGVDQTMSLMRKLL